MNRLITLHFLKPGLQTLVQDKGRMGYQSFGVPVSGALDKSSARIANWLVGNTEDTPVLEITFSGPRIEIKEDCQIAITGADISPTLNQNPIPIYETIDISSQSTLSFGRLNNGCRAYLAIRGQWQLKKWLDSYSALPYGGQEVTMDSFIQKGSRLQIMVNNAIQKRIYPLEKRPNFKKSFIAQVIPGPEFDAFSKLAIASFFSQTFQIRPESNRMGYRLEEPIQDFTPEREVISSGIIPGTIQITNSGKPVILLADAQTSGGYPRIANVISNDLDGIAQLKPGDVIRFIVAN